MKTNTRIGLLAMLLLIPCACGSTTRTVQYVYVDSPKYESERAQIQAIKQAKREAAAANTITANNVTASTAPAPAKPASPAVQSPRQRIRTLSENAPSGFLRGYGTYTNEDEDYAIDMAKANALRAMLIEAQTRIKTSLGNGEDGNNKKSSYHGNRSIEELAMTYEITNWHVLESYVSDGPMYEAVYCVEVATKNIIEYLEPVLEDMDSSDRTQVINYINRGY